MKRVYYLNFYSKNDVANERWCSLATVTKTDYICETLTKIGHEVEIISPCLSPRGEYLPSEYKEIGENTYIKLFTSLKANNKFGRAIRRAYLYLQLSTYLIKCLKKGDTLIVYHSLFYCGFYKFFKKITGCRLILEVEEIYADVAEDNKARNKELRCLNCADGYIFPTQLLSRVVNADKKPETIVHGTYKVEPDRQCNVFKNSSECSDRIIHCVYAGTLDPRKGGAVAAAAAEYLPFNYHVHILGFGSNSDVENIKRTVNEISNKSKAKVTYDGSLTGEDYIRFIQSCDIGLSTQNPDAAFNASSFPSKILSYMANGLHVASIRIPAIETSAIGNEMVYYDNQTPEEIAKAIMSVDLSRNNNREIVSNLDKEFEADLRALLQN